MFSGHTILISLLSSILHDYTPDKLWIKISIWTYCFIAILSLLMARYHYTIDILLAVFLALRFWRQYHWFAQNKDLLQSDLVLYFLETPSDEDSDLEGDELSS